MHEALGGVTAAAAAQRLDPASEQQRTSKVSRAAMEHPPPSSMSHSRHHPNPTSPNPPMLRVPCCGAYATTGSWSYSGRTAVPWHPTQVSSQSPPSEATKSTWPSPPLRSV